MTLASGGRNLVKLWDRATGRLLLDIIAESFITGLAFSPDGTQLAFSGSQGFSKTPRSAIFRLNNGRGARRFGGLRANIEKICLSPDGRSMAGLSQDWELAVWDLKTGRLIFLLDPPRGFFADNAALVFSPDGRFIAYSADKEARLWEVASGRESDRWHLPPGLNDALAFDRNGKKLLLCRIETIDGLPPVREVPPEVHPRVFRLRDLLSVNRTKPYAQIEEFNSYSNCCVSAQDGRFFLILGVHRGPDGWRQELWGIDGLTGRKLWKHNPGWPSPTVYVALPIDPLGKIVCLCNSDLSRRPLLEIASGEEVEVGQDIGILGPEARLYMSGPRLFRRADKAELVNLGSVSQFDKTGRYVFATNSDGSITEWDLEEVQRRLAEVGLGW